MKRRVIVTTPTKPGPQAKRASHFFAPADRGIYAKLKNLIENGTIELLHSYLNYMKERGYSIDRPCYPDQQTALHLAVLSDRTPIVMAMLNAGAIQILADVNNLTPIFLAVKYQKLHALISLITALGSDGYKCTTIKGRTILHMAVYWGADRILNDMLKVYSRDKDFINAKDIDGNTPLHCVSGSDDEKIVLALLAAGADPLIKNKCGVVPHVQAAINDAQVSFACLLTQVKEINYAAPTMKGRNLLHVTAFFGSLKSLKFLLNQYGHDKNFLNAIDEEGGTPLHSAALSGNAYTYGLILRAGADPTIRDKRGRTPESIAKANGCYTDYDSAPELMSHENKKRMKELDNWLKAIKEPKEDTDVSVISPVSAPTV